MEADGRVRGSAPGTRESRRCPATGATSVTARLTAASLARDGLLNPEIFLTKWREAFRISTSVVGGSKLNNGLMFRHMSFGSSNRKAACGISYRSVGRPCAWIRGTTRCVEADETSP